MRRRDLLQPRQAPIYEPASRSLLRAKWNLSTDEAVSCDVLHNRFLPFLSVIAQSPWAQESSTSGRQTFPGGSHSCHRGLVVVAICVPLRSESPPIVPS